jgi:hypothetical protein
MGELDGLRLRVAADALHLVEHRTQHVPAGSSKGGQFTSGGGGGGGAPAPAGAGPPEGDFRNPGPLPAGVKPTAGAIRGDIRKTLEKDGHIAPKKTHQHAVNVPGTKYASGYTQSKSGTTIRVMPTKGGHSVRIDDLKNPKGAADSLRARGYKVPENAASFTHMSFSVAG